MTQPLIGTPFTVLSEQDVVEPMLLLTVAVTLSQLPATTVPESPRSIRAASNLIKFLIIGNIF
jgi:hypothetical protein